MTQEVQRVHNGLQQTTLKGEMVHRDKYGAIAELSGQGVPKKEIARALGLDIKTIRKYLKLKQWIPYQRKTAAGTVLKEFEGWIKVRAPEVNFNGRVLFQELKVQGYRGGYDSVKRHIRPMRSEHRKDALATIRFETPPGRQGQVDWGSSWVWLNDKRARVHFFMLVLGFSRRLYSQAFSDEKLSSLIAGHEAAFDWFASLMDGFRTPPRGSGAMTSS